MSKEENKEIIDRADNIKKSNKSAFEIAESNIEKDAKDLFKAPKLPF